MLINQAEVERRINSEKNLVRDLNLPVDGATAPPGAGNATAFRVTEKPKREYTPRIQDKQVRILAGTLAHMDKPSNVSRELGLTPQQVSSAAHSKDKSVQSAVDATRDRVSELALTQLLGTLNLLDVDSLVGEKPKDLANIAASLSRVHANLAPRDANASQAGMTVVIYAPEQKPEGRYKVIDV